MNPKEQERARRARERREEGKGRKAERREGRVRMKQIERTWMWTATESMKSKDGEEGGGHEFG